jgi:hypothetical protein
MTSKTKPMRMAWGFVIRLAHQSLGLAPGEAPQPKDVVEWARKQPDLFPNGMTLVEAQWILANPNAFTDGEP